MAALFKQNLLSPILQFFIDECTRRLSFHVKISEAALEIQGFVMAPLPDILMATLGTGLRRWSVTCIHSSILPRVAGTQSLSWGLQVRVRVGLHHRVKCNNLSHCLGSSTILAVSYPVSGAYLSPHRAKGSESPSTGHKPTAGQTQKHSLTQTVKLFCHKTDSPTATVNSLTHFL